VLLEGKYLAPESLISPFDATAVLSDDVQELRMKSKESQVLSAIDAHSDYTYVGGDLSISTTTSAPGAGVETATHPAALPVEIIVVVAKSPVMRVNIAVGFVDSSAKFATLDEWSPIEKACNDARAKIGLPPLAPPESVARALREPGTPTPRKD